MHSRKNTGRVLAIRYRLGGINEKQNPERVLKTFAKHSSCSRSIRGVRESYGTQHLQIFIPNAARTRRMLPERFPCMPYAPRMLPEYLPNTHGRHIRMVDGNNFEQAQNDFWSYRMQFRGKSVRSWCDGSSERSFIELFLVPPSAPRLV